MNFGVQIVIKLIAFSQFVIISHVLHYNILNENQ